MLETGQIPDPSTTADRLAIYDVLVAHTRGVDRPLSRSGVTGERY